MGSPELQKPERTIAERIISARSIRRYPQKEHAGIWLGLSRFSSRLNIARTCKGLEDRAAVFRVKRLEGATACDP
jgi:hypothetical protein